MFAWIWQRLRGREAAIDKGWEQVSHQVQMAAEARRAAVVPYRDLADDLSALLFTHDPIGINFESNTDEYEPEAGGIVLRLASRDFEPEGAELESLVHEQFVAWFGGVAGPRSRYRNIAAEIQQLVATWTLERNNPPA